MNDRASQLAGAVRSRREQLGLRQAELAELAGCSTRFVHMMESGKATLRLDKVLDVLRVLGLALAVRRGDGALHDETR
jgi:y4mF family transcriptional regulator